MKVQSLKELLPGSLKSGLTTAETKLLDQAPTGNMIDLRSGNSEIDKTENASKWGQERTLRAELVRWLYTNEGASKFVHNKGIRIAGVKIEGQLDFESAALVLPLRIYFSNIASGIILEYASTQALIFNDCYCGSIRADGLKTRGRMVMRNTTVKGGVRLLGAEIDGQFICTNAKFNHPDGEALNADRLKTREGVFLNDGFEATGEVRMLNADIGGQLSCTNAKFNNPDGAAFSADGIKIKADILLDNGFDAKGEVRLLGAEIGGQLSFINAKFNNPKGKAISADGIKIGESAFLRKGLEVTGEVNLHGAKIGGNLSCNSAKFNNPEGDAFSAERMQVDGAMFWYDVSFNGELDLMHARVGQLVDDKQSWPVQNKILLDGFEYGALAGGAPQTATERLDWIRLQPQGQNTFWPQPYEQLAKVFRGMGHESDVRKVLIAKQEDLCRFGKLSHKARFWNRFLGITIGYGYQPWKAFSFIGVFIILGWFFFWWAGQIGVMQPSKERVYLDKDFIATQKLPDQYPRFQPFAYSIDVFIPFLDLHQEDYFLPNATKSPPTGWSTRVYFWFHIGFGWIFSSLAVASLTGLIRKE